MACGPGEIEKDSLGKNIGFFSNLVEEEGPWIQGVKDSRVCFLKILSRLSFFHILLFTLLN
jgi:hypothetical protein